MILGTLLSLNLLDRNLGHRMSRTEGMEILAGRDLRPRRGLFMGITGALTRSTSGTFVDTCSSEFKTCGGG